MDESEQITVMNVINKEFKRIIKISQLSGCNFHFLNCLNHKSVLKNSNLYNTC